MKSTIAALHLLLGVVATPAVADDTLEADVRARLGSYLDAFNSGDAAAVGAYWAADAVSVDDETGERTSGRDAILADFREFFEQEPGARLTGGVDHVRAVRPDVAIAEGTVTLFTPGAEPTPSAFTAVLVKENDAWVIESSQERDLPVPESSYDALKQLDWLVGDWRDDTDGVAVNTTVNWSPNEAFLIRSFQADYDDGETFAGTQVIGWDPRSGQYRTWTFNSDGSFGEGVVSLSGDSLLVRMSQVSADGGVAAGTQVITRVDDDTIRVEKIAGAENGAPVPAGEPVTVVRVPASTSAASVEGGVR